MTAKRRVGILTGGGDVPGLNSVIKSVVYGCTERDQECEVIGIRRGWEGLTHLDFQDGGDPEYTVPLNRQNTRTIDRTGGTWLHSSRTNPTKMAPEKLPPHVASRLGECKETRTTVRVGNEQKELIRYDVTPIVLENLHKLGLDFLVAIGGDDTLSYASVLAKRDFPVVAVPKTMDNDVHNTEYCIGFSTAMTRAVDAISRLRSTVGSHERIGVLRIFGRDAGFTALYAAYVTSLRCCIPEHVFERDGLIRLLCEDKKENPSRYAMVLLSEGATWRGREVKEYGKPDGFGHRKKVNVAAQFAEELEEDTGHGTLVADLTYELRSGDPDFVDRMVGTSFATMACECIFERVSGRMTAVREGRYAMTEIPDPDLGARKVDVKAMYNVDRFRPHYTSKQGLPIFMARA
jgi:6-phosphofructokinase 1